MLTYRVAELIRRGIPTDQILAITFTRSAAAEMAERVHALFTPQLRGASVPAVETFHALAWRILCEQRYPFHTSEMRLIDETQQLSFLEDLVPARERRRWLQTWSAQKQRLSPSTDAVADAYQSRLAAQRLLDFDDLLLYALRLFQEQPSVKAAYQKRFSYVLVDEFQDTSYAQYQLFKALAGEHVCVVGDPDQSIYCFGETRFHAFAQFIQDFPQHRVISLCENYRSQGVIVEAAKQVIAKNTSPLPRELEARVSRGLPVEIMGFQSDRQEAEMIVRKIEGLLGGGSYFTIDSGWAASESETYQYGWNDIAILYRYHAQARLIEEALQRAGLPYRVYRKRAATQEASLDEDFQDVVQNSNGAPTLLHPQGEAIRLMSLHRSKGLEFPVVFIAGCEEGVLPGRFGAQTPNVDEERRLFYVGMTRAKRRLFISYAKERFLLGQRLDGGMSRFVSDIQAELQRIAQAQLSHPKKRTPTQPSLF